MVLAGLKFCCCYSLTQFVVHCLCCAVKILVGQKRFCLFWLIKNSKRLYLRIVGRVQENMENIEWFKVIFSHWDSLASLPMHILYAMSLLHVRRLSSRTHKLSQSFRTLACNIHVLSIVFDFAHDKIQIVNVHIVISFVLCIVKSSDRTVYKYCRRKQVVTEISSKTKLNNDSLIQWTKNKNKNKRYKLHYIEMIHMISSAWVLTFLFFLFSLSLSISMADESSKWLITTID